MNELKAPSLQSLLESERSYDSLLAESLQLNVEDLDDAEYEIPTVTELPTLEEVLCGDYDLESDIDYELNVPMPTPTPTPSLAGDIPVRVGEGGSIMRYAMLQGVSAQVSSAADRINAGSATACAVCTYIAVGTSHGHILNFDITQTLRWAYQEKNGQGAVTTLSYNPEGTRLLAGYARGLIQMLDTQSGDVLRNLTDIITPNTGILHVKWTSRSALALCADSGGSVWSLSFTRKLGIRGCAARCLFSGARGEVCAVEPLIMDGSVNGVGSQFAELDHYCIVALATLSKYFIVTIRPHLKVVKYHALSGPPDCLPLLAWQMVLIQAADNTRSVDPVIVVGRGQQLFFHQLFVLNGRISLLYLRHVQLQANLLSAYWLGPKYVACMDTSEILHLLDVRSSKELECFDMANVGMVYASAQFKGLATGGNVSPALALAGTHACYNSMVVRGSQLYILGARSLHMIGVRSWSERISYLVKNQRWQEACDLALQGYYSANGGSSSKPKRKMKAKERIILLFNEYLANVAFAPDYCMAAIISCVIAVDEQELLWTQLWECLSECKKTNFLEIICEHINNENIRYVNPSISQTLVEYCISKNPKRLEELLLKLDWTCLDLNQVMRAAKRYDLYRLQIYLNTQAMNDYTVTLSELLPLLSVDSAVDTVSLGNCLLVYISSCLAGRGYPTGNIPAEKVQHVRHEVLRCLTSARYLVGSSKAEDVMLLYPYLRALLKFDTRETLNVISLAFQEREFDGEQGQIQRSRIINILLQIMTPDYATWSQIGCLLNFIAQQISLHSIPLDAQLLRTVLNYLATERVSDESARQNAERESAWHELLANNCLQGISSDEEQLEMARRSKCHYVEEYLLEKLQRYDDMLECYLAHESTHDVFAYMERHKSAPERKIYEQLQKHLPKLIEINASETARLIKHNYMLELPSLLETLGTQEELIFKLLQQLHARQASLNQNQSENLLELLCTHGTASDVQQFLTTAKDKYDAERALEIVSKHKLPEAVILLHEQQKDYAKAFAVALDLLQGVRDAEAEAQLTRITALCARACRAHEQHADLWLQLLQVVLTRADLKTATKMLLNECSQYVDLTKIMQLIMDTRELSGSFGDIKTPLLDMLAHARQAQCGMEKSLEFISKEMHSLFATQLRQSTRGLFITSLRCSYCQQRLFRGSGHILLSGACGHALHEHCAEEYIGTEKQRGEQQVHCLRCQHKLPCDLLNNPMQLAAAASTSSFATNDTVLKPVELKLKALSMRFN